MPQAIDAPNHRLPDLLDAAFAAIFMAAAVAAWTALTLAELGVFSRAPFFVAALIVGLLVCTALRECRRWLVRSPGIVAPLWVAVLLVAGGLTLLPPPDPLIGGADESVYLNLGGLITARGGLVVADPFLAATPPGSWPAIFSRDQYWPHLLNRFEGGVQVRDRDPRLRPNFFHLTPAWIAAVTAVAGARRAAYAVPLLAMLAPIGLFLLARRLATLPAAMAASALLVINVGHVWVGRIPLTEAPAELMIVSGLAFAVLWLITHDRAAGAVSGVAFGLAALDRIDALLLVVPVIAAVLAIEWRRGARGVALAPVGVPIAALTLQAVLHALTISQPYTLRLVGHVARDKRFLVLEGGVLCVGLVALARLVIGRTRWTFRPALMSHVGLPIVLAIVAWIAIRVGGTIPTNHLTVLLTAPGLAVAVAGLVVASRSRDDGLWLAIAMLLLSAIVYVEAPRDVAGFPRVFRRDVPVLLPMLLLFQARLLFPLHAATTRRLIGGVVFGILFVPQASRLITVQQGAERAESRAALAAITATVPSDGLVITDRHGPDHLDLALDLTADRSTASPGARDASGAALRHVVDQAIAGGRTVTFVTSASDEPMSLAGLAGLHFIPGDRVSVAVAADPRVWPAPAETRRVELAAFRLMPRAPMPWRPPLGGADFGVVLDGWHAPETLVGERGRWATATATLAVPALECGATSTPIAGAVRFATIRPAHVQQPLVAMTIEGREILRIVPRDSDFHVYPLNLTDALMQHLCTSPGTIRISTDAFIPRRDAGLRDDRALGIAVTWLELAALPAVRHE